MVKLPVQAIHRPFQNLWPIDFTPEKERQYTINLLSGLTGTHTVITGVCVYVLTDSSSTDQQWLIALSVLIGVVALTSLGALVHTCVVKEGQSATSAETPTPTTPLLSSTNTATTAANV